MKIDGHQGSICPKFGVRTGKSSLLAVKSVMLTLCMYIPDKAAATLRVRGPVPFMFGEELLHVNVLYSFHVVFEK